MRSLTSIVSEKANLIWSVADKITGVYKPHEYGDVILPLTVLKRFDCVLQYTKEKVLEASKKYPETFAQRDFILKQISGQNFYNTSKYDFKKLLDDPDNIEANLRNYINGFSKEVTDIIDNFDFDRHITRMANNGILYSTIETFNSKQANLNPKEVTNIEMGYIFEEIIRRFSESHNEEAGQHYTPREVIELMVNIIFSDENDLADSSKIKTVYDGACGTGGILSASIEYVSKLNTSSKMICYGQELNEQTYAICKADMLIKGQESGNIRRGNTLSDDQFESEKFDYIMMNPPFGREWKNEKSSVEQEAKKGIDGRFPAGIPSIRDSQLLFLQNAIAKMNPNGAKVAIIHNGSALWNGDAEQGENNIRKYIIENDLIDSIIQLPLNLFYNTPITTYIWILSNKKPRYRKNKIQLINASEFYKKRRKSLGEKKNDILKYQIEEITKIYGDYVENNFCKIFDKSFFGYQLLNIDNPFLDKNKKNIKINEKNKIDKNSKIKEYIGLYDDPEDYFKKEVLPFYPNAILDKNKIQIGYSIDFIKYFHQPINFQSSTLVEREIENNQKKIEDLLKKTFNERIITDQNKCNFVKVKHRFDISKEKALQDDPIILSLARDGVKIRDISTNEGQLAESYYEYNVVKKNDLLLNPMDLISGANCSLAEIEGVISPAYVNLRAKKDVFPKYYDYYFKLQYWSKNFFSYGKGVSFDNRWTLNTDAILNYKVPNVEYETQKVISERLNETIEKIDEAKRTFERSIELLEKYRRSIINEAMPKESFNEYKGS